VFETGFLADSLASRGTTPRSLKLQMVVQRLRLTTSSLAFVRLPMLRPSPAPSSPEPSRPPWFHVERRRPLARGPPFGRRAPAPVPDRWTVSRSRANGELHASKLDRAHLGCRPQACLKAAFRRTARARGECHEPWVRDLQCRELGNAGSLARCAPGHGSAQACGGAWSPSLVQAQSSLPTSNDSQVILSVSGSHSLSRI